MKAMVQAPLSKLIATFQVNVGEEGNNVSGVQQDPSPFLSGQEEYIGPPVSSC